VVDVCEGSVDFWVRHVTIRELLDSATTTGKTKAQTKAEFILLFAQLYFSMRPAQRVCFGVAASRLASS
jgi:hypothetical protein